MDNLAAGHKYVEYLAKSEQIKCKLWPISSKEAQTERVRGRETETDICGYNQRRKRTKRVQRGQEERGQGMKDSKGKWKSGKNFVQFIWPSKITCRCGREITTDAWVCVSKREGVCVRERGICQGIRQQKACSKWATSRGKHIQIGINIFPFVAAVGCCMWNVACGTMRALPLVRNCCNRKLAAPHPRPHSHTHAQKDKRQRCIAAGYRMLQQQQQLQQQLLLLQQNFWGTHQHTHTYFFVAFPYLFFVFHSKQTFISFLLIPSLFAFVIVAAAQVAQFIPLWFQLQLSAVLTF